MRISTVLSAAMCAAVAFAQGPRATNPGTPPDPATMVQMKVSFLTSLLGLSDTQKTQATTIYTNALTSEQTIITTLQTDMQSLQTAIKSNTTATIDSLSATIGTLQGQLLDINAKADAAFYAILTTAQQTTYDSMPHGGGPGGGPGGGFGPHGMMGPHP